MQYKYTSFYTLNSQSCRFNSYLISICVTYLDCYVLLSMITYHILVLALSRLGCCYMEMKNLEDAERLFWKQYEWSIEHRRVVTRAEIAGGMLLLINSISCS